MRTFAAMENKGSVLRWLHRGHEQPWGADPSHFDAAKVDATIAGLTGPGFGDNAYFRVRHEGFAQIPAPPVMMVSNHSGGTVFPDLWGLMWIWYRTFGSARPVHPAAHEMIFSIERIGRWFAERGVLRADPGLAMHVLTSLRRDLLVMPGGDLDTWRPWRRRYEVEFAGRIGYARTALRARVPIVPVANAGAHDTLMVLTDGRDFAARIGLHRLARASIFPLHLSLPWGLGVGPLPHIPLPVTLRYRVGEAIPVPAELRPGDEPDEAMVRAHDVRVRGAVQALLHALRDDVRAAR